MVLSLLLGCPATRPDAATYSVSGTVNLDGQPMPDGEITFISAELGEFNILEIKDGKYSGEVSAGKRKVEIRAFKEEKARAAGGMEVEGTSRVNYIPAKWNAESALTVEIKADGPNELPPFDITSQ